MAEHANHKSGHSIWHTAREHVSGAVVGGTVLVLTGFSPEHWVAEAFHALHIPQGVLRSWLPGFDARLVAVLLGMGIIVADVLFRQWRRERHAQQAVADAPALASEPHSQTSGSENTSAIPALPLPDKPSIAVLPFTNLSDDPEQEYFSDGIAEDIITMLSHSRSLFVIARNSSFVFKGRAVDVKQVARELGVRYVLEGSVRRGGNRVRVNAQLIEAETGNHLWAERYDRDLADVFAVQDEITEAVVVAIEPAVAEREQQRAVRKPPESLGAWEAYQRGLWHASHLSPAEYAIAKRFFRRAIDLDPNFAPAHGWLARIMFLEFVFFQTQDLSKVLDEALASAQRAVSLDPSDALAHTSLSKLLFARGDYEGALAEARQALEINSNSAEAHADLGAVLVFSGRQREGLNALRRSLRLDPRSPVRYLKLLHLVIGHYHLGEYDAAIEVAKEAMRAYPDHPLIFRWLAAALGQTGRLEEARAILQKATAVTPKSFEVYVRQRPPWTRPEDQEHMLDGLRKAGWEG